MRKVCIVGNHNAGKSTFFNLLTKSQSHTGNWAGVTVETFSTIISIKNKTYEFVDLPGSYGLRDNGALDEKETSNFLLNNKYDLILNLIDITSLKKSLPLTMQLFELGKPVLILLNKVDLVNKRQALMLQQKLKKLLNCQILLTSNKNLKTILKVQKFLASDDFTNLQTNAFLNFYPQDIIQIFKHFNDISFFNFLNNAYAVNKLDDNLALVKEQLINKYQDADLALIELRYEAVKNLIENINIKINKKPNHSDSIDQVLLNKFLGLPFFLLIMYITFYFSIKVSGLFQDFFADSAEKIFIYLPINILNYFEIQNKFISLVIYSIGTGVKTVAAFIPLIACLYLFITFLEEFGYLSRSAFIMNRFLKKIGLDGRSLIPIIVGFGCNVPAIMSTRIIQNKSRRLAVILAIPFMLCSARLTVFLILSSLFFENHADKIIFLLYLIGISFGVLSMLLVHKLQANNQQYLSDFVIELPDYQFPKFSVLCSRSWNKTKEFILGAGKLIIITCFIIQILNSFSFQGFIDDHTSDYDSILVTIGKSITPLFKPMGIQPDNWPASVALITGILAKEVILGTLNSLYSTANIQINFAEGNNELKVDVINKMKLLFNNELSIFCYMLFILLYFPCVSVFAIIKKELNLFWVVVSSLWSTIIAYTCAVLLYQIGSYSSHFYFFPIAISSTLLASLLVILTINIRKEIKKNAL